MICSTLSAASEVSEGLFYCLLGIHKYRFELPWPGHSSALNFICRGEFDEIRCVCVKKLISEGFEASPVSF